MTGTLYWLFVIGFYYFFVMHGNALLSSVLYVYVKKKKKIVNYSVKHPRCTKINHRFNNSMSISFLQV